MQVLLQKVILLFKMLTNEYAAHEEASCRPQDSNHLIPLAKIAYSVSLASFYTHKIKKKIERQ